MRLRALSIGSGWGRHAARVFATDPRTELCGLVGRGSARTEALAAELAVPVFGELSEAVAAVRPQIASVAAHYSSNVALVDQLLSADCHVLCSHPVAPTAKEVQQLAERSKAKGLVVATDYTLRLQPGFTALVNGAEHSLQRSCSSTSLGVSPSSRPCPTLTRRLRTGWS